MATTRSKKKTDKDMDTLSSRFDRIAVSKEDTGKVHLLSPLTTRNPTHGQKVALDIYGEAVTNLVKRGKFPKVKFSLEKMVDEMNRTTSMWVFELPTDVGKRNKIRDSFKFVGFATWGVEQMQSLFEDKDRYAAHLVEENDRLVEEKDRMAAEIAHLKDQLAKSSRLEQLDEDQEMPDSRSVPVAATPRVLMATPHHRRSYSAPTPSSPSPTPSENAVLMGLQLEDRPADTANADMATGVQDLDIDAVNAILSSVGGVVGDQVGKHMKDTLMTVMKTPGAMRR